MKPATGREQSFTQKCIRRSRGRHVTPKSARSSAATARPQQPVSWLTYCNQERKWWNTAGLKLRGPFIVPSTDYHKLSSVRNTLWREGTEAYTSADNPCVWDGSHDVCTHTHTHTSKGMIIPSSHPVTQYRGLLKKQSAVEAWGLRFFSFFF